MAGHGGDFECSGDYSVSFGFGGGDGYGPMSDERDGHWGDAGGLPTAARPAPLRAAGRPVVLSATRNSLVAIHDHLRSELTEIRDVAAAVAAATLTAGEARSVVNRMTLRSHHWQLGAFCAQYCRVVTMHHTIEDQMMFPMAAEVDPSVASVIDRLSAEHLVIHHVLERFDQALVVLVAEPSTEEVPDPAGPSAVAALADELSALLLSHLAYEEDELSPALAELRFL